MKTLAIDIETRPNLAYVWGLWDQNVHLKQIVESGEVICFAARFLGQRKVHFHSTYHDGKDEMVKRAWELLDEADAVLHYNGKRFDMPHLSREFVLAGLGPPSPYEQIDLLLAVRKQFKFPSNKLEYVSRALGFEGKAQHNGFELWSGCMAGDKKSWNTMRRYNIRDVTLLEELYEKLLPWLPNHPNQRLYIEDGDEACPRCGTSGRLQKRGYRALATGVYQQYHCGECGAFSRGTKRANGTDVKA